MLMLVNRYTRTVGRGMEQWDTDSGKTHAAENGVTLCGRSVGSIRQGWEETWGRVSTESVSCAHCAKKIAKMEWIY